ncbi:hypothetical protein B6U66_02675 [Candidatus Bathyarchaeota archaeon ex4484_135]|nr:MAG: hypothetical protein B6U66_02675 [Candidatus Bathyarchaeota archaeon ex4484_135]
MSEEKRGVSWLVLLGLILIGMGIIMLLGVEWFPAILIVLGVVFLVWGLLARAGMVEEKE